MAVKKIINDRQRARRTYGFVQRLPDRVSLSITSAESDASVLQLDWKESVKCASTTNISLPPGSLTGPIDGVTLTDGARFLLKNQTTSSENGIYEYDAVGAVWTRTDDAQPGTTLTCGAVTYVEQGSVNAGQKWLLSTQNVTVGGPQAWVLFDGGSLWLTNGTELKTNSPVSIGGAYPSAVSPDVFFYVSGSKVTGAPLPADTNIALFGGDVTISGTLDLTQADGLFGNYLEISGTIAVTTGSIYTQDANTGDYTFFVHSETGNAGFGGSLEVTGSIEPGVDDLYDLGSPSKRWANVYTGDLHLRNDRGDWTLIEEEQFLTVRNNKTEKVFKLLIEPIENNS